MTGIVRGGKRSSLEPHFLSIALLDWTITRKAKQKYGYVCVLLNFSVKCEACHCKSRLFYTVRAGTEQEETVK